MNVLIELECYDYDDYMDDYIPDEELDVVKVVFPISLLSLAVIQEIDIHCCMLVIQGVQYCARIRRTQLLKYMANPLIYSPTPIFSN